MKSYRLPVIAVLAAVAVVVAVLLVDRGNNQPQQKVVVVAQEPSPSPESPSPSPSPSPEPSPIESAEPTAVEGLPSCFKRVGADASREVVRSTLTAAGRKQYWTTTKGIVVPPALMKALAWQKSRWQSSIVSCDGNTVGVMQVSPKTAAWLNERFTVQYDVHTLKGNAALGAEYLEWLIKHYGETTYASSSRPYDVMGNKGMLDMVIAAYSAGASAVDPDKGLAGIPNPEFVAQVKALMTTCPCSG